MWRVIPDHGQNLGPGRNNQGVSLTRAARLQNIIRLAVEGGGQVKAELVSVGQSGEQTLKDISKNH
jgi:hypothetical protein